MKMIVETLWLILLYHLKIVRADTWSFKLKHKYPLSSKISLTLLNIFYGPRVESSSSVVCDVVNKKFDRMVVSITLPFKQSIIAWMLKHLWLTLSNLNQVQVFQMLDRRKSPPHSVYWGITPPPPSPPPKKTLPSAVCTLWSSDDWSWWKYKKLQGSLRKCLSRNQLTKR